MKVHSNFAGQPSKKRLLAFSCATALASFAIIARPAFAEEAKADSSPNLDTTAATTANVETTADLVEAKVVEAPAATENTANTESTTIVSEQATTSTASSETTSEIASTTTSQAPAESAKAQTREAVTTDRAASETATPTADTNSETNVTGGQYYSDSLGNWYYKDASGKNLTGDQTVDGVRVSFQEDGKQIKGPDFNWSGNLRRYFDDNSGQLQTNRYLEYQGNWYYLGKDGYPLTEEQTINGQEVYFDYKGVQIKGDFSGESYSYPDQTFYYDLNSGAKVRKEGLVQNKKGQTFYIKNDGSKFTGIREIDGNIYYFKARDTASPVDTGVLQKGTSILLEEGQNSPRSYGYGTPTNITRRYYFDPITGQAVKNRYVQEADGWYYYGEDGNAIRPQDGEVNIDGQIVYLYANGRQAKGELVLDNGILRYYDPNSGTRVSNTTLTVNGMTYRFDENGVGTDVPNPNGYYSDDNGNWYYKNANGDNLTGAQIINGQKVFFRNNGQQVKGAYGDSYGDLYAFYDINSGNLVTNRYVEYMGNWFYLGKDGKPVKGARNIDGQDVFFNYRGVQAKGGFGQDGVYMPEYYYDKDNGRKVIKAGFVKDNKGLTYYLDEKGEKVLGLHEINGDLYYFRQGGAYKYTQLGDMWQDSINYIDGKIYYFDQFGKAVKNRFVFTEGAWHYFYGDGTAATGAVQINGQNLYFDTNHGRQVKGYFAPDGRYYDENSGELVTNQTRTINGVTYHFDENGRAKKV
ncbi:MAG: glucosyl transferase [Streptococcus sp.]|uniref:glucosyl transferase n=1 Tax=Streptococcus sp. TaxID=1306 RepID=UPI001D3D52AA|nr:glucosyl transferase [Streptococcus sp.]MBS6254606.1 glucosyl transferase [Streptococcus sp.]